MKVTVDKVTVYPPHALCKADIPVILSLLPGEWTAGIRTVRLSSSHGENPTVIAFFHPPDGSLLIKSRGFTKKNVLRALVTELAGHAIGIAFLENRRLQNRDRSRIERLVTPLVEEILPKLSRKKVWLER